MGWQDSAPIQGAPAGPLGAVPRWSRSAPLESKEVSPKSLTPPTLPTYTPTGTGLENFVAGAGRGMVQGGLGLKEAADAGANWLRDRLGPVGRGVDALGAALGLPSADEASAATQEALSDAAATDAPLMATTGGKVGNVAGMALPLAATAAIPGANTYTGAALIGGGTGFLATPGDLAERAYAGVGGLFGAVGGKAGGDLLSRGAGTGTTWLRSRLAKLQDERAVKDASLAAGQGLGMVAPVASANPTLFNRAVEGVAGKLKTAERAAVKNQPGFNDAARTDLGLSPDAPLTLDTLRSVRSQADAAGYAPLDRVTIRRDPEMVEELQRITTRQSDANDAFPGLAKRDEAAEAIEALISSPEFSGKGARAAIAQLREDANTAFANKKGTVARGLNQAAGAIENVIERNLAKTAPDLLPNYRAARQLMARTYTVERALNTGTGNVKGQTLAAMRQKGKPMSGQMGEAARFAQAFPKASREVVDSAPLGSPLDTAVAVMAGAPGLGMMLIRPALREALLTRPAQNLLASPSYAPGMLTGGAGAALQAPMTQNLLSRALAGYGIQQEGP